MLSWVEHEKSFITSGRELSMMYIPLSDVCAVISSLSTIRGGFAANSVLVFLRSVFVCFSIGVEIRSLFLPINGLDSAGDLILKNRKLGALIVCKDKIMRSVSGQSISYKKACHDVCSAELQYQPEQLVQSNPSLCGLLNNVFGYPQIVLWWLWSDCVDLQSDMSLPWIHM